MSGRGELGGVVALAITLVAASFASAPAQAGSDFGSFYADCWFSVKKKALTVRANDEEAEVRRVGGRIVVLRPGGQRLRPERCRGGKAKLSRTNRIRYLVRSEGETTGRLSLAGGPFEPGAAGEAFAPEIEIKMIVADSFAEPQLEGSAGSDLFRGGRLGPVQGFNLNPLVEPLSPDVDFRMVKSEARFTSIDTGAGGDVLDMSGGPEFSGPMSFGSAMVVLGAGDDRLVGSAGTDFVIESPGLDSYATGDGDDAINSQDGLAETVDCGLGADRVQPDPTDVLIGCEELGFVGLVD